jgi:hypothetical protein
MEEQNDRPETPYERGARRARELHNGGSSVRDEADGNTAYEQGARRARDRRPATTVLENR